ncbi:hypothetical protein [Aneurinibacillus terranovensis]|uniref:hypothetical protein n=1 Tax=Aneurinibacillus terranovensis TaxID=278991 RepID=UPI000427612F|nr:hypothetical protein [Aneurinibacillus terranovensis]
MKTVKKVIVIPFTLASLLSPTISLASENIQVPQVGATAEPTGVSTTKDSILIEKNSVNPETIEAASQTLPSTQDSIIIDSNAVIKVANDYIKNVVSKYLYTNWVGATVENPVPFYSILMAIKSSIN